MAFSSIFDCAFCGLRKQVSVKERADTPPTTRVHYEIEDRKLPESSESIDSSSHFTKVEKPQGFERDEEGGKQESSTKVNGALVVASKGTYALLEEHSFPQLVHDKEVIISNRVTGLNPIDYKSVDYNFCLPEYPWITGREMAGVVEAVGAGVTDVKVGDEVWTSTYYRDRRAGCFQHYIVVPAHTVLPIPPNLDFTTASILGVAGLTASMTLWRWLGVPPPSHSSTPQPNTDQETLLLWGGSTVTGQFAIQLAIKSHLKVLAITSSKTVNLAISLGAEVITRDGKSDKEIVNEIRALAGDSITKAIDLVGPKTASYCLQALSRTKKCVFAPLAMIDGREIVPSNVEVVEVLMKEFVLDEGCRHYAETLNSLVEHGELRLPEIEVLEGGLEGVVGGLEILKKGGMGGRKLVVRMS